MPSKKTSARGSEQVEVVMSCIYSGDGYSVNKGETVKVDAAEADRLIGLGVATAV